MDATQSHGGRIHGTTNFALRHWGEPTEPLIVMLHGWADCSASFQFVADALCDRWHIVAPDWRGYGGSEQRNEPLHELTRTGRPARWKSGCS